MNENELRKEQKKLRNRGIVLFAVGVLGSPFAFAAPECMLVCGICLIVGLVMVMRSILHSKYKEIEPTKTNVQTSPIQKTPTNTSEITEKISDDRKHYIKDINSISPSVREVAKSGHGDASYDLSIAGHTAMLFETERSRTNRGYIEKAVVDIRDGNVFLLIEHRSSAIDDAEICAIHPLPFDRLTDDGIRIYESVMEEAHNQAFYQAIEGLLESDDYYSFHAMMNRVDTLDGAHDSEHRLWFMLSKGASLETAVRVLADFRKKANKEKKEPSDCWSWNIQRYPFYIRLKEDAESLLESSDLLCLCRENKIHIIRDVERGRFEDYTDGNMYCECFSEYPGSADDAATYVERRFSKTKVE